jgi:UDP-N-acetylglucosamine 4,6-dehydratase
MRFVIGCLDRMRSGEIFIPKIPNMKMTELANVIAPNAKIKIIGIRPGEKIHEVLITEDESRHSREFDNFFVIEPEFPFWNVTKLEGGKVLPEGFRYSSDNNKVWLTKKKLEEILK